MSPSREVYSKGGSPPTRERDGFYGDYHRRREREFFERKDGRRGMDPESSRGNYSRSNSR